MALLSTTTMSVSEIATDVGFGSARRGRAETYGFDVEVELASPVVGRLSSATSLCRNWCRPAMPRERAVDPSQVADIVEIEQLLARYAAAMTKQDVPAVLAVFAADGWYSAFGDRYGRDDFPTLLAAAPQGLYSVSTPAIELDGDRATGVQPLCFVTQTDHSMRIGYYTDTYRRTPDGWRLQTRTMTFLRRSGARDSGRPHDPRRPRPAAQPAS
jgi:hypothetical protein